MAQTQAQTGKSIKNAKTSREVFQALKAQITEKGAIVKAGEFAEGVTVAQVGQSMPTGEKSVQRCRTNKFLPEIADDLKVFMSIVLTMSVEDARDQAYAIKDRHCVNINVWSDDANRGKLIARRPFSGKVEEREYFSEKEGIDKTEHVFTSIAMDDLATVSRTLDAAEFELEDEGDDHAGEADLERKAIEDAKNALKNKKAGAKA